MAEVVGIKFKHSGKVYFFDPCKMKLSKGDGVIVETARGVEYGKVVSEPREVPEDKIVQPLKPIVRRATADDEARVKKNEAKVADAMKLSNEKIAQRGLKRRKSLLLRELHAGFQKSNDKNGENAGLIAQSRKNQRALRQAYVLSRI